MTFELGLVTLCLAVLFTDLSVAVGLVGAGIGAFVGLKFIAYDRNFPLVFAIAFFGLFLWLARLILFFIFLALAAGVLLVVILYRERISDWMATFAENAGLQWNLRPLRTFTDRIGEITDDFLARRKDIGSLPLDRDEIEDILRNAKDDFTDAVSGLSAEFPYLNRDQQSPRRSNQNSRAADDDDAFGDWLNNE